VKRAALLLVASCGARGAPAAEPATLVVAPAPAASAAAAAPAEPSRPAAEAASPLEIAIGGAGVCARIDGRVHCTSTIDPARPIAAEPAVEGIDDAVSIALGRAFTCAATRAGKVLCWGDNTHAELGAGLRTERSDKPVAVRGLEGARRVFAGDRHACAILDDGSVRCWGANDHGQTGGSAAYLPAARELALPNDVPGVRGATVLALGHSSSCALLASKEVACFGRAVSPDHERAKGPENEEPFVGKSLGVFDDLAAMQGLVCGVRGGDVWCWGDAWSVLAGVHGRSDGPHALGLRGAKRVRLSQTFGCALTADGAVWCFGQDYGSGVLGHPPAAKSYEASPPERVSGAPRAVDVVVGNSMSCAITHDREVWCWGSWSQYGGHGAKEPVPVRLRVTE
jgi:hypothetical protein